MRKDRFDVRVARIGKPHGIRGEVTVEVFTESPDSRFAFGRILTVQGTQHTGYDFERVTVERARWNNKVLLLKFAESSDRNTAESLRDAELYAPAEYSLDDTGWYADALIGLPVYEISFEGEKVGEVIDLITREVQDLLEIRLSDGHEVLVPFVEEIVPEIDEKQGVVINPPPGLLELSQE